MVASDYAKQTWANGPGGGTPITAARLAHMEDGIDAVTETLEAVASVFVQQLDPEVTNPEITGPAVWYVLDNLGNLIGKKVRTA